MNVLNGLYSSAKVHFTTMSISKLSEPVIWQHFTPAFNQPLIVWTMIVGGYTESDPSALPQHQ